MRYSISVSAGKGGKARDYVSAVSAFAIRLAATMNGDAKAPSSRDARKEAKSRSASAIKSYHYAIPNLHRNLVLIPGLMCGVVVVLLESVAA